LGHAQKCGRVKPINGILTFSSWIGSPINKR
jgi:hypothetical protein